MGRAESSFWWPLTKRCDAVTGVRVERRAPATFCVGIRSASGITVVIGSGNLGTKAHFPSKLRLVRRVPRKRGITLLSVPTGNRVVHCNRIVNCTIHTVPHKD